MTALLIGLGVAVVVLLVMVLRLASRAREVDAGVQAPAPAEATPATNVAVVTRYDTWMRRVQREQLGSAAESWADLSRTGQYAAWRQLAKARGAGADVQNYLTRSLLSEVIYAAGGVERELGRLRKALAVVQKSAGEAAAGDSHPSREGPAGEGPVSGSYVAARPMREACYSFVNLLSWARITVERTDRRYRPGSPERAGLLPALAQSPLREAVEAALRHLRAALRDSRFLASYALHAGAVPGSGTPDGATLPDGRILAQVPDPLADPVLTWEAFEFTQHREMLTYATDLMTAIEIFVNTVLDAFAANRPARAGPPPA
jgi:hypothetical protein